MDAFIFDQGREDEVTGKTLEDKFFIEFVFSFSFDGEVFVYLLILGGLLNGTEFPGFPFALRLLLFVHRHRLWCSSFQFKGEDPEGS
jgi:hypothetical protein